MNVLDAINQRRSVRHYTDVTVHPAMIRDLLRAATMAPSALNQQPWAFAVIRGRERLARYSPRAKDYLLSILPQMLDLHLRADQLASESYNVFHGAGTVIAIYARPERHHPTDDCWLAAQNLMLAAHAMGLGTCLIGFARPWLDLPVIKSELGVPQSYTAVAPIVVGWPAALTPPRPRDEPEIACWLEDSEHR